MNFSNAFTLNLLFPVLVCCSPNMNYGNDYYYGYNYETTTNYAYLDYQNEQGKYYYDYDYNEMQ